MRVAALMSDLLLYSRIAAAADLAGASLVRATDPAELPPDADLVLVDWSERATAWADALRAARDAGARVVLFGRHTDVEAHRAARAAALGPMWARSKLLSELPSVLTYNRT